MKKIRPGESKMSEYFLVCVCVCGACVFSRVLQLHKIAQHANTVAATIEDFQYLIIQLF